MNVKWSQFLHLQILFPQLEHATVAGRATHSQLVIGIPTNIGRDIVKSFEPFDQLETGNRKNFNNAQFSWRAARNCDSFSIRRIHDRVYFLDLGGDFLGWLERIGIMKLQPPVRAGNQMSARYQANRRDWALAAKDGL